MTLRVREGLTGYSGLQHCGSVWADPVCAGRILVHRALEIGAVLGRAIEQGHPLAFVTLTMAHHRGQSLAELWAAAQKAWRRATGGKGWQESKGHLVGMVRVWEVTYGRNGWHVHVHLVLVLEPGTGPDELELIAGGMYGRWSRGLTAAGLDAPRRIGQDWHIVGGDRAAHELGGYLSKMAEGVEERAAGLGLELTHSMPGRSGAGLKTAPTWALLDHLCATGEVEALTLWHEWERVSKGKRQVGWSRGLRERFAPEVEELSDDEVVAEEVGTASDDVVRWSADQWREFVSVPSRLVSLLDAGDRGGPGAVVALLDEWGVKYERIKGDDHG